MSIYSHLEEVPLPSIVSGPLDEKILPLIRAVGAHHLLTMGSCEGHIGHFYPYPWVSVSHYEDTRLLQYLVDKYNQKERNTPWTAKGTLKTKKEASNEEELRELQRGIQPLAEFLFDYRPEVLDPHYTTAVMRIPDPDSKEYQEVDEEILKLIGETKNGTERPPKSGERMQELLEKLNNLGSIYIPDLKAMTDRCLTTAKNLLEQ